MEQLDMAGEDLALYADPSFGSMFCANLRSQNNRSRTSTELQNKQRKKKGGYRPSVSPRVTLQRRQQVMSFARGLYLEKAELPFISWSKSCTS